MWLWCVAGVNTEYKHCYFIAGVNAEYVQPVLLHRHERQPAMVGQEFTLQCIFQGR